MDFRLPIDMDDVRLLAQIVKLGDLLSTHLADRLGRRHPPQDSCVVPLNETRKTIVYGHRNWLRRVRSWFGIWDGMLALIGSQIRM